jgi:hypothetical protein
MNFLGAIISAFQIDGGRRFWLSTLGLGIAGGSLFCGSLSRKSGSPRPRHTVQKKAGYQTSGDSFWGFSFSLLYMPSDRCYQGPTTHAMKRWRTSILSVSGPIIQKATSVGSAKNCSVGQVTRVMTDCMCGRYCS